MVSALRTPVVRLDVTLQVHAVAGGLVELLRAESSLSIFHGPAGDTSPAGARTAGEGGERDSTAGGRRERGASRRGNGDWSLTGAGEAVLLWIKMRKN